MRRPVRTRLVRLATLAAVVPLMATGVIAAATPPAATASVSVGAGHALAAIPSTGVGTNVAVYDGNMNSSDMPGLLSAAGIRTVRYPGGGYSDGYRWETNAVDGG